METDQDPAEAPPDAVHPTKRNGWLRQLPWIRLSAEFGVIFLGITLSLLADDWRQGRSDRSDERVVLSELLADLADEHVELSNLQNGAARHDRDAWWIFERLGDPAVNADSAGARFSSVHFSLSYQPINATYAGLRSTGRLTLIQDEDLRRSIVRYFEERQEYIMGFVDTYGGIWSDFTESAALDVERGYSETATSFDPSGEGRQGFLLRRPWIQLPTDPMFRYRISTMGTLASVIADRAGRVALENEELQTKIQEFLEL